ncbi:hypothetical protein [Candidatus Harpocratesius sp.]
MKNSTTTSDQISLFLEINMDEIITLNLMRSFTYEHLQIMRYLDSLAGANVAAIAKRTELHKNALRKKYLNQLIDGSLLQYDDIGNIYSLTTFGHRVIRVITLHYPQELPKMSFTQRITTFVMLSRLYSRDFMTIDMMRKFPGTPSREGLRHIMNQLIKLNYVRKGKVLTYYISEQGRRFMQCYWDLYYIYISDEQTWMNENNQKIIIPASIMQLNFTDLDTYNVMLFLQEFYRDFSFSIKQLRNRSYLKMRKVYDIIETGEGMELWTEHPTDGMNCIGINSTYMVDNLIYAWNTTDRLLE